MAEHNQRKSNAVRMRSIKALLVAGFALIVAISLMTVSSLTISKTDSAMKVKVSSLVSTLNVQMKLNLENYLSRMESTAALAFASNAAYTYDATDSDHDEYEALNTEKIISDELYSLCIMENFVDYAIVYRNNHPVGKMSNGTVKLFGDRLFDDLHAMITRQRTADGWSAGYADNFKRLYYVKEIHENALIVISFYTSELENVFDNSENMPEMTVRLTDGSYEMIYSSDENEEPGQQLPPDIQLRVAGQNAATVLDDDYLTTVSACGDNWYVICSIPTQIILKEKNEMRLYIILVTLAAALLATLFGMVLSIRLSDAAIELVTSLDNKAHTDQLTGIYNKKSFEEFTQQRLESALPIEKHALILLDVDNFKGVNDTLGHAYGDKVLAQIGRTLLSVFTPDDFLGRIGGDEFCVFMSISPDVNEDYAALVRSKCEALSEAFHQYYTGDNGNYKISCSMGAALFPVHGMTFPELYAAADHALYESKHKGKDTYTVFDAGKGGLTHDDAHD